MISASNVHIVEAKKLLQKKYRDQTGRYLAEGQKLLREAIYCAAKISYVVVDEDCVKHFEPELSKIDVPIYEVSTKTLASLCDTVTPQGVVAVLEKSTQSLRAPKKNAVILEEIQDPSNVGAILRTAAATGFDDVYLIDCADPFSPKCMRSGMSAQFRLNLFCSGSREEVISTVKSACAIVCADMDGQNIFECQLPQNYAILLGNEGNGVSEYAKQMCDIAVSLPMKNDMESLNVAVCAGVMMYSQFNKIKR